MANEVVSTNFSVVISEEVRDALNEGTPVVSLESAAVSRGFPPDIAFDVEKDVEAEIRLNGAVPALCFIQDGKIRIGGTSSDISAIAGDSSLPRASRGSLAQVLGARGYGVTTVSSSMIIAEMAGIRYLSVSGIGGVHRGAFGISVGGEYVFPSLDVSPDLEELARTQVCVVGSGAKSFLDPSLTLEWLETKGVPTITVGSEMFPGY